MNIDVRQEHIDKGSGCHSVDCPVAHAVRDAFEIEQGVSVRPNHVMVTLRSEQNLHRRHYELPKEAQRAIENYDKGKKMKPFQFPLGKMTESLLPVSKYDRGFGRIDI